MWSYHPNVFNETCGLEFCAAESEFLAEELQSAACSSAHTHKVTLVLDGGNIDDGTFNQVHAPSGLRDTRGGDPCRIPGASNPH